MKWQQETKTMDEIHCRRGKSLRRGAIILWRPASQAIDGAQKGHRVAALWTLGSSWETFICFPLLGLAERYFSRQGQCKLLLESPQARTACWAKESVVPYFHKSSRQDMLQKALDKFLCNKGASLDLSCFGRTIPEGYLGIF